MVSTSDPASWRMNVGRSACTSTIIVLVRLGNIGPSVARIRVAIVAPGNGGLDAMCVRMCWKGMSRAGSDGFVRGGRSFGHVRSNER